MLFSGFRGWRLSLGASGINAALAENACDGSGSRWWLRHGVMWNVNELWKLNGSKNQNVWSDIGDHRAPEDAAERAQDHDGAREQDHGGRLGGDSEQV